MAKKKHTEKNKKKLKLSLAFKIGALATIPALVMSVSLTIFAMNSVRNGIRDEILQNLHDSTISLEAYLGARGVGDFVLNDKEQLLKGNFNITENSKDLDKLVADTGIQVTLFYDNIRRATTIIKKGTENERIIGTPASDEVYERVVKRGESMSSTNITINEEPYYAWYAPMKNADGTIVGMYFAGSPTSEFTSYLNEKRWNLILIALIIGMVTIVVIIVSVRSIKKGLTATSAVINQLADGHLNVQINPYALKRSDELGDMARQVEQLQGRLFQVMNKVRESAHVLLTAGNDLSQMASQTSTTADDISHAVEDISRGAISQAEEIETASSRVDEMGNMISKIVGSVTILDTTSSEMKTAGDQSVNIIRDLSQSNDKTMAAIERIGQQVNATNESANNISEAIQLITSIAEETNLLSLNASIEAARAGEQGRGFAVVANQIQKLAEQSNESAQKIADIIDNLVEDSEKTVTVMNEVQQIVDEQQKKLNLTKSQFNSVNTGIAASRNEASEIKEQTTVCDTARSGVVDVITNLSSISQQNASSTQETTASMEELNATINLLAESAANLTALSTDLEQEIKFFKL